MLHVTLNYGNRCLWGVQYADQNRFILLAPYENTARLEIYPA